MIYFSYFKEWQSEYCEDLFYMIIYNLLDLIVEKYSSKVIQKIVDFIGNVIFNIYIYICIFFILIYQKNIKNLKNLLIKDLFYNEEFMNLIKNKYAYFNIKNFIRFLNSNEKLEIKNFLLSNMEEMNKKEKEKYMNFLNSISN